MLRSSGGRRPAVLIILGLLMVFPALIPYNTAAFESLEQAEPVITHNGIECMVTQKHAIIRALVQPANEIRVVRVYFRSALYPEFYFVEATRNGDQFEAIIPRPKAETKRIVYYIEAVTHDFAIARTNNFEPEVTDDENACKDDDVVPAYYAGGDPNIVVGITQAGVPAIPPGFQAIGLAGRNFPTTPVLVAAGGAGAAAIILAGGGNNDNPTTSVPSGGETTTSGVTTSTPGSTTTTSAPAGEGPVACFTTDPDPPRIREGDVVRFDGDCSRPSESGAGSITSFQWDFGDGGSREGRFVQRTYDRAGTYTVTLRVTNQAGQTDTENRDVVVEERPVTTTTTSTVPNQADVSISKSGPGSVAINTNFTYTVTVDNGGPRDASNVVIDDILPGALTLVGATFVPASAGVCTLNFGVPSVSCTAPSLANGSSKTVTITVRGPAGTYLNRATVTVGSPPDPNLANNTSNTVSTTAALTALDKLAYLGSSFASSLELSAQATAYGQVIINGEQIDSVNGSNRLTHVFRGPAGENVVEAYIVSGDVSEGIWRFDFREAAHFMPGSIQVDSGQVVSQGPLEVVFRVTGTSTPRIRFHYQMER